MQELIADELNVKQVRIEEDEHELVHLQAKANFKKLGRQLGPKMKAAAAAISALEPAQIENLRHGNIVTIQFDEGENLDLTLDDIEIRREEKPGLAVANEGEVTVALDLNLDHALELEGIAGEIKHAIQEKRKALMLAVTDRIQTTVAGTARIGEALAAHRDYLKTETLCEQLSFQEAAVAEAAPEAAKVGEDWIAVNVEKL